MTLNRFNSNLKGQMAIPLVRRITMKIITLFLILFQLNASALTPEEQQNIIEENKFLKQEVLKSKTQINNEESKKMMEVLQKGKKHQEDQIEFLKELDQEEEN